jgi:hypothetical protein
MTDISTLITRRESERAAHKPSSRTNAAVYQARHQQLRREIRMAQAKEIARTVAEFAALAIFVGFVLIVAGIVEMPV